VPSAASKKPVLPVWLLVAIAASVTLGIIVVFAVKILRS
jgi:hypothetical protein